MPIDSLPSALIVPGRDKIRDDYLRDYRLRLPNADTSTTSQAFIDASVHADAMAAVYANAIQIANFVSGANKSGQALLDEAARFGTSKLPAAGAVGYVVASASTGGGTILAGTEIRNLATGLRYQCIATALYLNGAAVPIAGIDTGPTTNVNAGVTLTWTSPPPGIGPTAVVSVQADGSGLSGGRNTETDTELAARLILIRSTPAASGNDAQFQQAILNTPGQQIGSAFTYPAILGPGSNAFALLLKGSGAARIPNSAQIAAVYAWLVGQFPADDSINAASVVASPVKLALQVTWAPNATGWIDPTPWPQFASTGPTIGTVTSATSFQVNAPAADIPQVGQTIAIFDYPNAVFRRKKILTATFVSGTTYAIVCDTTNNSSDTGYTPIAAQLVCPWSDSLNSLAPTVIAYFDSLGPGEMVTPLPDPGLRMRRSPTPTTAAPYTITSRILAPIYALSTIADCTIYAPSLPYVTPVGTVASLVNLMILTSFGAYP